LDEALSQIEQTGKPVTKTIIKVFSLFSLLDRFRGIGDTPESHKTAIFSP